MAKKERACVHLSDQLLLSLWAQVAVDGGLDLEQVLDHILEIVCATISS